ncbi:MAG: response regulator [Ignavibacteriaceae bacterium]|jgi:CheY-like chemotaxis protein
MRILIVEDRKHIQRYYTLGLDKKGVRYDIVDSRLEAIEMLKKRSYEGAIVDLQLTDDESYSQGIEVLKYIEAVQEGTNAIVVSGTPHPQDIIDSYEGGAVKVILKADKSYPEIAEEFADQCKNVKIHYFGKFPSLNAYLASPDENAIYWEDSMNKILKLGYQDLNKTLNKAFKDYLPILRPIKDEKSFQMDTINDVAFGSFWSKGKGFPIFLAMMKSDNKTCQGVILPKGAAQISEIQPVKNIIVNVWKLNDIGRNEFHEFVNDIAIK